MKAHELIDAPKKWCKGAYARDAQGNKISFRDGLAALILAPKHCAAGAYAVANGCSLMQAERDLEQVLCLNSQIESATGWNDSHRWEDVYAKLKELDI
jgi:hypothetical protein